MELIAQGKSYRKVAQLEHVTTSGIVQRVDQICEKLGARNPVEALAIYLLGRR